MAAKAKICPNCGHHLSPSFWTETHASSRKPDWATPPEVFDPLNEEFGFTLDVCASAENAKVAQFFTEADDGLIQNWGTNICWMNPPYGRMIGSWVARARWAAKFGATVVCLLPARTDTRWWQDNVWNPANRREGIGVEVRFMRGRVKFLTYNGQSSDPAPFPTAIVIFSSHPEWRE